MRQHTDPGTEYLVDKFHDKNVYFIALRDGSVIGMLAVHGQPLFSAADRLPDPSLLDRLHGRPLEVRLLAIQPAERHKLVFASRLCPTISICFVNGNVFPGHDACHSRLRLLDDAGRLCLTEDLTIHVIEISKFRCSRPLLSLHWMQVCWAR